MSKMIPGLLALAAVLWLLIYGARSFEERIAPLDPDSAIVIDEPDAAPHPAAAPDLRFCDVPAQPRPQGKPRRTMDPPGQPFDQRTVA